jgi:butyrate kinase
MKLSHILAINPGSTSTKIGLFKGGTPLLIKNIEHTIEELNRFSSPLDEMPMRENMVKKVLEENNFPLEMLDALVGRGGLLRPIPCGTYPVSDEMVHELREAAGKGGHASNLGGLIARNMGTSLGIPSYIVDPVIVDELVDRATFTGLPSIRRKSIWHALNQKAVARRAAVDLGKSYDKLNLIVTHLGGGITIGAHRQGKTVDVNDGLNGDGPFSPQRTGSLPAAEVVDLCFSGDYGREELLKIIQSRGGLTAYFGTQDARDVCRMIDEGDALAERVYRAMAYRISCSIGAMSIPLGGNIDGIILTGGLAYEKRLVDLIKEDVSFLGKVMVYPGEDELQALTEGVLRVLEGKEEPSDYVQAAEKWEKEQLAYERVEEN